MDTDQFFLKKFAALIVETITADEQNISDVHVECAMLKKWYPGISIYEYLTLLNVWKIVKAFYNGLDLQEIIEFIEKNKFLNQTQKDLCKIIFNKWSNDHLLLHALPDAILNYKNGQLDFKNFVDSFIARKNPY